MEPLNYSVHGSGFHSNDPRELGRAIVEYIVNRARSPHGDAIIAELLHYHDPGVRVIATHAVEVLRIMSAVGAVTDNLTDASHHVRIASCMCLGVLAADPDKATIDSVRALTRDLHPFVTYNAYKTLIKWDKATPEDMSAFTSISATKEVQTILSANELGKRFEKDITA